jgi:Ca2+-binding RTX toxin-like protein
MANFVPTTNMQGQFSVGPGEYALIGRDIAVSNVNAGQVTLAANGVGSMISNEGSIFGYVAIDLGNDAVVYNHAGGSIRGSEVAVFMGGNGNGIVDNAGSIFCAGIAISTSGGGGTIRNSGTIVSGYASASGVSPIATMQLNGTTNVVENSGTIRALKAGTLAIDCFAVSVNTVTNTGRIIGGIDFGNGNDTLDTAAGNISGTVLMGAGDDSFIGSAFADNASGGIDNDTLNGNSGNDILNGNGGADILIGGLGRDLLTGGTGNDTFRYALKTHSVVGANADRIMDFDIGGVGDKIDVSALFGIAMTYRHNDAFTAAGQVRINDIGGEDLIVEVNTGGTLAADFSIRLVNTRLVSMSVGDFVL